MTKILFLDTETYSECPLLDEGLARYKRHPSSRVLMLTGAYNAGAAFLVDYDSGTTTSPELLDALTDPNVLKVAWNAEFDRQMLEVHLGVDLPIGQWYDAMVLAYSLGLPGKLEMCAIALGLPEDERKMRDGRRLIQKFSKPFRGERKHTPETAPEDWAKFCQYGTQDAVTLRSIWQRLEPYKHLTLPHDEFRLYLLSCRINEVGIPIDLEYVQAVLRLYREYRLSRFNRAVDITGLENPNSVQQLLCWFEDKGLKLTNLRADTVRDLLAKPCDEVLTPEVKEVLTIRQEISKSSVSKYDAMWKRTNTDGRLRDQFQFYGAHTGRWAGRGVQPHNFPQGTLPADSPEELDRMFTQIIHPLIMAGDWEDLSFLYGNVGGVLSSCIRPAIKAPPGKTFLIVDYASIETAVVAWLSGCKLLLNLMHDGLDPYRDFAASMFNIDYDEVSPKQRKFSKPAVLGCVYGLGAVGYQGYASGFGVNLEEAECQQVVTAFRERYREIKRWWWALKSAFTDTVRGNAQAVEARAGKHVRFHKRDEDFLFTKLPSGRSVAYPYAEVNPENHPEFGVVDAMSYMGLKNNQWVRINTHPGKLAENFTQAVARDLLAEGLRTATDAGFEVVLHVHDEVVALVDEDDAQDLLSEFTNCLLAKPDWAEGIPLRASGFISNRYYKD